MSFDFNYKFWVATKKEIEDLIKRQNVLKKLKPITNPLITYTIFSELYILYADLVNKLGHLYHYTFQVQKRVIVRALVEAALRRLLELKNELKNLELSEYVYTDKALIKRKLTPLDLAIWRSPQFLFRRSPDIQNIIYENQIFMTDVEEQEKVAAIKLELNKAIIIIQAHERARAARVYKAAIKYDKKNLKIVRHKVVSYTFRHKSDHAMSIPVKRTIFNANFVRTAECCQTLLTDNTLDDPTANKIDADEVANIKNSAALKIQSAWRAYKGKKMYKSRLHFKQTLYGMQYNRKFTKPNKRIESTIEMYKNELLKKQLDEDFIQLMNDERTRLLQERGPWIMEDISDHIRAWFKEFYHKVGDFHPYPDALKSGTVLLLIEETMTPEEFQEKQRIQALSKEEKKKRAEKIKLQKEKEKEKRRKEKMKEARRRKKMKDAGIFDISYNLTTNKNMAIIEETIKKYSIDWRNVDEYLNKSHEAIKEWVTEDELAKIHRELRALVDEFMRIEHELLRRALCTDLKKKYKPAKQKKPKAKKGKKKAKHPKDMTADRTIESLYEELQEAGIIENYVKKSFTDFIADCNFVADDLRDEYHLTTLGPAKGDIKIVIQDCLLGMGEFHVDKPKSICLIGPLNHGKRLLCKIIASELDAVFMNLSPEKTMGFTENLNYLIHVVLKVAKAFQPTILYIEDVHRIFWKKIPKDQEHLNPTILQNALIKKIMKPIKKDDKIMILGTSETPWAAKPKLKKAFQKVILIPRSDYGTSFLLWLEFLSQNADEYNIDDYEISSLAKVLQNYNSGDVSQNVSNVLNINRRMRLKTTALNPREFLENFIDNDMPMFPPEEKLMEKYDKWFKRSNKLAKLRAKFFKKIEMRAKKK